MPTLINGKYQMINLLVTPEIKKILEKAAEERGVSVGSFLKMTALEKIYNQNTEKK
jgi:uncharacterized protein (DUF1778 family)